MKDHIERVIEEAASLNEKRDRLFKFFGSDTYRKLDISERNLLSIQHSVMTVYLDILNQRISSAMRDEQ
jgi:hypothetical protein